MSIVCAISDSVWFYAKISRLGNFLSNGNIRVKNFGNVTVKIANLAKKSPSPLYLRNILNYIINFYRNININIRFHLVTVKGPVILEVISIFDRSNFKSI